VSSGNRIPTFRDNLSVLSSRVKKANEEGRRTAQTSGVGSAMILSEFCRSLVNLVKTEMIGR
jgi:hypothetical protein